MLNSRWRRRAIARCAGSWLVLALLSVASHAVAAADAKPSPLKLSVAVGPAFALGKAADAWARRIAERAGDALSAQVFPGATLAHRDASREFVALREGAADLAVGSSLPWSLHVPALAVASLPWIAPTARQLQALCSGTIGERLMDAVARSGAVPLAVAPLSHRELITLTDRVHAPADMSGLRVRVAANPLLSDFYASLGAVPANMAFAAAREALAAGTLEGQEGAPVTFLATRLDAQGLKFVTVWHAIGEIAVFAASRKTWDGLTQEQRSIVGEAAREAARDLGATADQESEAALETLRQRGVTVTRLLAPSRLRFAATARPMFERWKETIGSELVEAAEMASREATP